MSLEEFLSEWNSPSPYVHVQTSGSTGDPKSMLVEKSRMLASARITCHSSAAPSRARVGDSDGCPACRDRRRRYRKGPA
jgi:hypothetical protein